MSNRYGQAITWGPLLAPALFSGAIQSYSFRDQVTKQNIDDASGDFIAMALHSRKAEVNFEAKVTSASTNFLDLSAGAALAITGGTPAYPTTGTTLVRQAVEKWALGQPKMASIQATYYPDITQLTPAEVETLSALTPTQTDLTIVSPGGVIIYGTYGFSHASGIVHALTITQALQITEDDPSPAGKIVGAASHGYERTISLDLLAVTTMSAVPAVGSPLSITGTGVPSHAADYKITSADVKYATLKGKMYAIEAAWIPPFTA